MTPIIVPKPFAFHTLNGSNVCFWSRSRFSSHHRKLMMKVAEVGRRAGMYGVDHPSGADSASLHRDVSVDGVLLERDNHVR